jgi:hypothetical protein
METVGWTNLGGSRFPIGMGVDFDGNVWAINRTSSTGTKIDADSMAILMETPTGPKPYSYSDMTGFQQKTIVAPQGTYVHEFEGWVGNITQWLKVSIDVYSPGSSASKLRVRAADTKGLLTSAPWTPYFGPFPPNDPSVNLSGFGTIVGRYLQVEVMLIADQDKNVPKLKNIDVVATQYEQ